MTVFQTKRIDIHLSQQGSLGPSLCRNGSCAPTVEIYQLPWLDEHKVPVCSQCRLIAKYVPKKQLDEADERRCFSYALGVQKKCQAAHWDAMQQFTNLWEHAGACGQFGAEYLPNTQAALQSARSHYRSALHYHRRIMKELARRIQKQLIETRRLLRADL